MPKLNPPAAGAWSHGGRGETALAWSDTWSALTVLVGRRGGRRRVQDGHRGTRGGLESVMERDGWQA